MQRKNSTSNKIILKGIQSNFPIASKPYQQLANEVHIPDREIYTAITKFKKTKVIRRLGGVFASNKLGFISTLVGVKVSAKNLNRIGKIIAKLDEVTHCYARNHPYNLWFTLTCKSQNELKKILNEIKNINGITNVLYLPSVRTFKIRAEFKLE